MSVVFEAEFLGLTEMGRIESPIPQTHQSTFSGIWDTQIYREGTLKKNPFGSSPVLKYKVSCFQQETVFTVAILGGRFCYKLRKPMKIGDPCFFSVSFHHYYRLNGCVLPKFIC